MDNVVLNPGSGGATVAADEIGGVQYQRGKLVHGKDGVNDGDVSRANPLPARDTAVSPQISSVSTSAVAPGGEGTVDSAQISVGETGKLLRVDVTGSALFKAVLRTVADGLESGNKAVGIPRDGVWVWETPQREFVKAAYSAGAGFDGFRVVVTNLDTGSNASDFYATFYYDEEP